MSSGTLELSSNPGIQYSVNSNSCADVSTIANAQATPGWTVFQCSPDPVVNGSLLYFKNPSFPQTVYWTVKNITATADLPSESPSFDFQPLIGTVIVCSFVLLFFLGFHSGVSHGNR